MKAFILSSALLAVALADSCSDCTAVVSTIAARLSSEESIAAQQVVMRSNKLDMERHTHNDKSKL